MSFQLFRLGHDLWGRPVLEGIAWDLPWAALGLGAAVIIGHGLWRLWRRHGRPH